MQYDLFLADDDIDDCVLFKDALSELPVTATLTTVNDGVELMNLLFNRKDTLPHILFLDLNMPRKTGFDCLIELKKSNILKDLPIVIFSTSYNPDITHLLYENGANYYVRKPATFSDLKNVIHQVLMLVAKKQLFPISKELFLIRP